jgi:hypothetical protein
MEQLNMLSKDRNIAINDFNNVSNVLVDLMNVLPEKELSNGQNQNFVLEDFEKYLTKLLTKNVLKTREERAAVTNFLYKIHARREKIAILTGELDIEEIKNTSGNLGKRMAMSENEPFGISVSKR